MSPGNRMSLVGLAAVLAGSGVFHLVRPETYRRMVPGPLVRWRSGLVLWSGVGEMSCALLLVLPQTRRIGAYATAFLFVAVFPANVHAALNVGGSKRSFPANNAPLAWLRLPLQIPLVWWALSFRRGDPGSHTSKVRPADAGRTHST